MKEPVRAAGWSNQLNTFPEFSIAFWRWSIWKLFEADNAPGKGVIAFISNRTFLAGKPYAGLRKMLRERFDRIEIIDLRGDLRRGERAGVLNDEGVFNIQVGTAITLAIADGSKEEHELAQVQYSDCWEDELLSRRAKLDALQHASEIGFFDSKVEIGGGGLDTFRPAPFSSQGAWPGLDEIFQFKSSGLQSKRDHFAYDVKEERLKSRLTEFALAKPSRAAHLFHDSRDRKWIAAQARVLNEEGEASVNQDRITDVAYRPFDRRKLYNDPAFGDFLRPALQQAWGPANVGLYSMPFATGAGPATWCHSLLPDYHSFSGRGGYAFPLFDHRPGHGPINLKSELIDGLSLAYQDEIDPEAAFDAILALLSATSYTLRFAEDLEDVFPHVPIPASRVVFDRAAVVGAEIRKIETFARSPSPQFTDQAPRIDTTPRGSLRALGPSDWDEGAITLCADGSGTISGIPSTVWHFKVSGYRALQKWLAGREGLVVDKAFLDEFRDITARINELIHLFDVADLVLQDALKHTLTRRELGLD